jgi:hypothetical protein
MINPMISKTSTRNKKGKSIPERTEKMRNFFFTLFPYAVAARISPVGAFHCTFRHWSDIGLFFHYDCRLLSALHIIEAQPRRRICHFLWGG